MDPASALLANPASVTLTSAMLLAHQGGWDEALMVVVPVGAFAVLLYGANKRAGRLAERARDGEVAPLSREVDTRNERGGPR